MRLNCDFQGEDEAVSAFGRLHGSGSGLAAFQDQAAAAAVFHGFVEQPRFQSLRGWRQAARYQGSAEHSASAPRP